MKIFYEMLARFAEEGTPMHMCGMESESIGTNEDSILYRFSFRRLHNYDLF